MSGAWGVQQTSPGMADIPGNGHKCADGQRRPRISLLWPTRQMLVNADQHVRAAMPLAKEAR